eukprot:2544624-Pyramimonas_sp.AAC.1
MPKTRATSTKTPADYVRASASSRESSAKGAKSPTSAKPEGRAADKGNDDENVGKGARRPC